MRARAVAAWWMVGCAGDPGTASPGTDEPASTPTADTARPPTDTDTETDTGAPSPPLEVTEGPTVTQPAPEAPLGRLVHVCASAPTLAVLRVDDGEEPFEVNAPVAAACHDLPVLGLRPDRTYALSLTLRDDRRELALAAADVVTAPLPTPFPTIEVHALDPARVEPGVRFFNVEGDAKYVVGVDERARIVWLLVGYNADDIDLLPENHLLLQGGDELVDVDLLGRVARRWVVAAHAQKGGIPVQVAGFSHETVPGANGSFYTLFRKQEPVEGYPTSYVDPTQTADVDIADNLLVEFDEATGARRWGVQMGDVLDRRRIGYDSLGWEFVGLDWGHANAVQPLLGETAFLVSMRHQDATLKLDRSGVVDWIFAPPANWPPELAARLLAPVGEPFTWSYHQHSPEYDPSTGALRLFDNGNQRASPYTGEIPLGDLQTWSRLVEYHVDESARTVAQVWSFDEPLGGRLFSDSRGDVDRLPVTGNVLGTYASVKAIGGQTMRAHGKKEPGIRLIELAFDPDPVEVMDLELSAPLEAAEGGWHSYRTEFVPQPFPR